MTFKTLPRTDSNWDPFHEFFQWLANNQTTWCVTASNYYETMLYETSYCPGSGPISESFCTDFVETYVTKCVRDDAASTDDKSMVAVFAVALCCALLSGWVTQRSQVQFLPESAVCILVGVAFGALLYSTASTYNQNAAAVGFDSSIFFLILVPPIALQSLLEVNPKHFCRNFPSILWLAVLNTILTCLTVGFLLFLLYPELTMPTCLLIGAISSSVDPTTLRVALAKRIHLSHRSNMKRLLDLDATIFGESTLNDGVSFVLYKSLLPLVVGLPSISPQHFQESSRAPSSLTPLERTALECIGEFSSTYFQSFGIGCVIGFISALVFRCFGESCSLRHATSEHSAGRRGMVVFVALMLLPYFICELNDFSGLVALCGSTFFFMTYVRFSLSEGQRKGVVEITRTWSKLTEFFLFSYLGFCLAIPFAPRSVSVSNVRFSFDWKLIAATCGICVVSRGWIVVLGLLSNILRKKSMQWEWRGMVVMLLAGIRGPVAFALAMSVPGYNYVTGYGTKEAPRIAACLTSVVIFTTFCLGGSSDLLLSYLYPDDEDLYDSSGEVGRDRDRDRDRAASIGAETPLVGFIRTRNGAFMEKVMRIHEWLFSKLVLSLPVPVALAESNVEIFGAKAEEVHVEEEIPGRAF